MRIGFFLSTAGGSPLLVGLDRGFTELGHTCEVYREGGRFDLVIVANQTAHIPDYRYPDFPSETRIAFIDTAEFGYFTRLLDRIRKFANTFTPAAMAHDTKNTQQQTRLYRYLEGKSFPYFLREYCRGIEYPASYHPIDYPLYAYSVCDRKPDRHQYMTRAEDFFISWGASHPWRWPITHALRAHPCKKTVLVLEENGTPRMPQMEYFERMENAKASVSFDGYGSGSFRMTEVLCRTVLLQGPLSIVTRAPLIDGDTCIEYQIETNGEDFISTNIGEKLQWVLDNPEAAFRIYENAYDHVNTHLTEVATAQYVLDVCEKHNWSKPTPLEVV